MSKVIKAIKRLSNRDERVIAIDDYCPEDPRAVAFKKGDKFNLHSDAEIHIWALSSIDTGDKFYAPAQFLALDCDTPNFDWISFDITRDEAQEMLMDPKYPPGSFIIRARSDESISHTVALTVKAQKRKSPYACTVSRFLVRRERGKFRIDGGAHSFDTLTQLIEHYADRSNTTNISLRFSVKKDQYVIKWEYNEENVVKGRKLDGGDFGEVFIGLLEGKQVAIKTPNQRMEAEDFIKEAEISRKCRHPNVLETLGVCRSKLYSFNEFLPNGDLKKYLRRHKLTSVECLSIARKIASAMEYLHCMKIVHRDLAARNILVGETIDTIKVADFGLARSLQDSKYYITQKEAFPLGWTAPEGFVIYDGIIVTKMGEITSAADVWSFGIVLWELYSSGQDPYLDVAARDLYRQLTEENWRLARPAKCSEAIYDKMLECWTLERKSRPAFIDVRAFLDAEVNDEEALLLVAVSETEELPEEEEVEPVAGNYQIEQERPFRPRRLLSA